MDTPRPIKNKHHLGIKGWKKIFQANGPKKQVVVATLIFEKIDFKPKLSRREREGHYMLVKGNYPKRTLQFLTSVHQAQGIQVYKETL